METKIEYPKLPPKFKAKWLEALRSGDYKQGYNGELLDGNDNYCCLGVACRVVRVSKIKIESRGFPSKFIKGIPRYLSFEDGNVKWQEKLSGMNDGKDGITKPKSFNEIADWIEKHL